MRDGRVRPKGNYGGALESATVTKFMGNHKVERGKPHKRETQILVGELQTENQI